MYTIDIHHKGDDKPTSYIIFKEEEANEKTSHLCDNDLDKLFVDPDFNGFCR